MDGRALLDGLNERQVEAVVHDGGPLVVMAGAGSGKTRVLTRRIAYRVATGATDPQRVLALTFTRKAAAELRERLRRTGLRDDVVAGTFHAVALTQLRQRWNDRGIQPPAMLDRKYGLISQLMGRRGRVDPLDVVSEIEWARARLVGPDLYGAAAEMEGRTSPLPVDDMADIMERYQQEKRRRRVVDFDDLLALATRDLVSDPDYAAAIRWRHRHLYVDEFQDVNPLQFELLHAWRGTGDDLFVVGDPNQAIYGWNGADPQLLTAFARREPTATVIELSDNYRSTPQILTLATAALGRTSARLEAHRGPGSVPTLTAYPTDRAEADGIARAIRSAKSVGDPWAAQAVLVRTNAQLVPIEQALAEQGIPVRVRGGSGPLSSQEVKSELRSLGREGVNLTVSLQALDESLEENEEQLVPAEIERRQNLAALSRLVHEYVVVDPTPTGPGLLAWLATVQASEVAIDVDAVELTTFHGAKGLEWPVVHVAGLEQGLVPISYAKTGGQLAEEQRLLYVGITRAERALHLSWAAERTFGTRVSKRQPSQHLDVLQSAIEHLRRGYQPTDWRAELATTRNAIPKRRRASSTDVASDPLFEALRTWRQRQARAADVPAFVIFDDKTLRSIAKRRPLTKAQLAGMPGVGPVKLERFGDQLLAVVASSGAASGDAPES